MRAPSLVLLLAVLASPGVAAAQDEETFGEGPPEEEHHLYVTAMGGALVDLVSGHGSAGLVGGEIAYAFPYIEVGVLAQAYKLDRSRSQQDTTPVLLLRLEQVFETRRGLDALLALGIGAARTGQSSWQEWFQFAIGMRLGLGPIFVTGELGFEQTNLFRLAAGLGFRL